MIDPDIYKHPFSFSFELSLVVGFCSLLLGVLFYFSCIIYDVLIELGMTDLGICVTVILLIPLSLFVITEICSSAYFGVMAFLRWCVRHTVEYDKLIGGHN